MAAGHSARGGFGDASFTTIVDVFTLGYADWNVL